MVSGALLVWVSQAEGEGRGGGWEGGEHQRDATLTCLLCSARMARTQVTLCERHGSHFNNTLKYPIFTLPILFSSICLLLSQRKSVFY